MADIGTVLGAAQTLFAALECSVLKELCSALGYKCQLEDLKSTVETVKSVLLDAAASEELTHAARDYIEKLKAAVYDADDLFDEFRTVAERKQQLKDTTLFEKVRLFFSSDNPLKVAHKMSKEIKKIGKNLDGIARDHTNFRFAADINRFDIDTKRINNPRKETWSYVNAPSVIGREADLDAIVDRLLDFGGEKGARFLTVVGIGGMGKTTLAQLVCGDERVKKGFSNLWWVCVADEADNQFDIKAILCKILDLATHCKHQDLSLEEVHMKLRGELEGKKYLLVLDDVWNENKVKWMELKEFLMLGAPDCRIMVTTRSHDVAEAIGNSHVHVLEGLSDENSWSLFEVTAFEQKPGSERSALEVEIGKKIVKQCSNVPLAIKVVGSLLYGQGINKWQTFEKSGLGGIRKRDNQIMSILKLSYHNLEPSLKSCFTYCALFPKDYEIKKEVLIRHWMAHGYIVPFDRGQSIEEASEEHFLILLRRCFFQDVRMDKYGNVESFKMHDLIHDVAQEVSGQEILVAASETTNLCAKVRHVYKVGFDSKEFFYSNVKIRSYLRDQSESEIKVVLRVPLLFTNGGCLRTLTLVGVGMKRLPHSIGKLLHLRYLDISNNTELKTLCGSITKLHNLQTLKLERCNWLTELPRKLGRLVNLMHLNIAGCPIQNMPAGMDKLTTLCELSDFVVVDESSSGKKRVGHLNELKTLVANLKGFIEIHIRVAYTAVVLDWEGSVFESAEQLQGVAIEFPVYPVSDGAGDEVFLEKLLPCPSVKKLQLRYYRSGKIPSWLKADSNWATLLPNLVTVDISQCYMLKHLPVLSQLKHLKSLILYRLDELEYIDEMSCSSSCASGVYEFKEEEEAKAECNLFPSLESLIVQDVFKLKGFWAGVEFVDRSSNARLWQQSFPHLSKLIINGRNLVTYKDDPLAVFRVVVGRVDYLKSLPTGHFTNITLEDRDVENLGKVGEVYKNCSSLRCLALYECCKLSHLSGGLEHLTMLESLTIERCGKLNWEACDEDGTPWKQLHHNLRSLKLSHIQNLKKLPKGLQHLTSLQNLEIEYCHYFEALPEWISCFSSLQSLAVVACPKLKSVPEAVKDIRSLNLLSIRDCSDELNARCQEPEGEDWPKIQHIPNILRCYISGSEPEKFSKVQMNKYYLTHVYDL